MIIMSRIQIEMFCCHFQWVGGFFSFLYPIISAQQRESFMPTHIYFGLAGYIMAIAAALLGLCEKTIFKLYVCNSFASINVMLNIVIHLR